MARDKRGAAVLFCLGAALVAGGIELDRLSGIDDVPAGLLSLVGFGVFGLVVTTAGFLWNTHLAAEKVIVSRDHMFSFKAAHRSLQLVNLLVVAWYAVLELTAYDLPTTDLLLLLLVVGVLGRIALYHYYARSTDG
jgi:hypothetical protein